MAITLAKGLQALGVSTELAMEIQDQIDAGTGNLSRLLELGMVVGAAKYLAAGITAGSISAPKLAAHTIVPAVAVLIAKSANAPRNTVLPAITGTAQVGQVLTSTTGTWVGTPTPTYARAWTADGVVIAGATAATYTPVIGDVGKVIRVVVTATNANGSATATSNPTAAVIAA